ncbi:hypothetical protein JCM6882_003836 [Rhodosporidiobolus microsporus]
MAPASPSRSSSSTSATACPSAPSPRLPPPAVPSYRLYSSLWQPPASRAEWTLHRSSFPHLLPPHIFAHLDPFHNGWDHPRARREAEIPWCKAYTRFLLAVPVDEWERLHRVHHFDLELRRGFRRSEEEEGGVRLSLEERNEEWEVMQRLEARDRACFRNHRRAPLEQDDAPPEPEASHTDAAHEGRETQVDREEEKAAVGVWQTHTQRRHGYQIIPD